jgi:hypothetical protein
MKKLLLPILFTILALTSFESKAQCDTVAQVCNEFVSEGYISDGQEYRALLINDEKAEFYTTFYGGATYRVAACSGFTEGNLIFRIFDAERNLLFDNQTYNNAGYWDFTFTDTQECTIEAQLDNSAAGSGCAVILINFKQ